MNRRALVVALIAAAFVTLGNTSQSQAQENGYGAVWGGQSSMRNLDRFYHYPYVYYPQNFWGSDYYRSSDSLYHRYPQEMRIPVYNRDWRNEYPSARRYHWGHQFLTDVF